MRGEEPDQAVFQMSLVETSDCLQTDFRNQAMLRQHEEGPAHKKALAREKAEREREAWVTNPSAAANALVSHWSAPATKIPLVTRLVLEVCVS